MTMCYLRAPISLDFRAGEGTPSFCSKDSHGPQPAGAVEKEERQDEAGQCAEVVWPSDRPREGRDLPGLPW